MPRPLVAYGTDTYWGRDITGNRIQGRAVVATTSKTAALRALELPRSSARYMSPTGGAGEVAALAHPGEVWWCPVDCRTGQYVRHGERWPEPVAR